MLIENRKEYILKVLADQSFVRVADLSEDFGMSEVSIRKLLASMEQEGLLKRSWGGAVAVSGTPERDSYVDKSDCSVHEKQSISAAAYERIGDGDIVYLDAGTTTRELARRIAEGPKRDIVVCTGSVYVLMEMMKTKDIRTIFLGGELRQGIAACVGALANQALRGLSFDKAFLSGLHFSERGFSVLDMNEAGLKQDVIHASKKTYVMMDSSKYGEDGLMIYATAEEIDFLVTDSGLSEEAILQFEERGLRVIRPRS